MDQSTRMTGSATTSKRITAARFGRWLAYGGLGLVGLAVVLGVAAFLLLDRLDLGPLAASRAAAVLGRPVSIASLRITPGRWFAVDLRGVRVANIPGGSREEMSGLVHLTAEVEAMSLLRGPLTLRHVEINGLSVLLEHVADGTPNWRHRPASPKPADPENRSWFPTLSDVHFRGSEVIERTSSGKEIRIGFDEGTLRTAAPDAPVRLEVTGAYNDIPVTMAADLQPIAVLRDAGVPYGVKVRLASGETTLGFEGTMTKPFDADGANGALTLHAPTISTLLAVAGAKVAIEASLDLTGRLTRLDALWVLADATGRLDDSTLAASTLRLVDGGRGHADKVESELAFERLNLTALLAGQTGGKDSKPITIDNAPDPLLDARVTARQFLYLGNEATDFKVTVAITPGRIDVNELAMLAFGARLQASAHAVADTKGNTVSAEASVSGMDVQQLRRGIGARDLPLNGSLDAQMVAASSGETLNDAVRSAPVSAIVSMNKGTLSRDVVEKASIDIRQLFRTPRGTTAVTCLLGVFDMRGGVGTVRPLRIRTAEGTIAGQGSFDLNRKQLDVVIGSQSATTSNFALDVPLRISGAFSNPDVRPSNSAPSLATVDLAKVPPGLSQMVRRNPCVSPR